MASAPWYATRANFRRAGSRTQKQAGEGFSSRLQHAEGRAVKSFLRRKYASGSTRRRVDRIMRLGERATKRALRADRRRELAERLAYGK